MSLYHLAAKVIGRSSGRSATGAAAYRAGELIRDERTGIIHDYTRKGGVEHREIIAPENAPEWMHDRSMLWNAVERIEARKDAQLSREVEVALPRELSPEDRLELVREFVRAEFVSKGMVADIAIHDKAGEEKPHAHIMLTMRELMGEGFGKKARDWNGKDQLEQWRERWGEVANRALERAGRAERIDHRSYAARGIDREAQPKLGAAQKMERRGVVTERGAEWRNVQERNAERGRLSRALADVKGQIVEVGRRAAELARAGLDALRGQPKVAEPPKATPERQPEKDIYGRPLMPQGRQPEPPKATLERQPEKDIYGRPVTPQGQQAEPAKAMPERDIYGRIVEQRPERGEAAPRGGRDRDNGDRDR